MPVAALQLPDKRICLDCAGMTPNWSVRCGEIYLVTTPQPPANGSEARRPQYGWPAQVGRQQRAAGKKTPGPESHLKIAPGTRIRRDAAHYVDKILKGPNRLICRCSSQRSLSSSYKPQSGKTDRSDSSSARAGAGESGDRVTPGLNCILQPANPAKTVPLVGSPEKFDAVREFFQRQCPYVAGRRRHSPPGTPKQPPRVIKPHGQSWHPDCCMTMYRHGEC